MGRAAAIARFSRKREPCNLRPCADSNLSCQLGEQIKTYRLDRGPVDPDAPGCWKGFTAIVGEEKLSRRGQEALLDNQWIAEEFINEPGGPNDFTAYVGDGQGRLDGVWLAAPKTTDSLYLAPTLTPRGLIPTP